MSAVDALLKDIPIPKMLKVRQKFDRTVLKGDLKLLLAEQIKGKRGYKTIQPGMDIAIAVGSRGIANLPVCVKVIVEMVRKAGARPFIVPAMGSHGGATAGGQEQMLLGMGITPEFTGAPIRSSMETVQIGTTAKNRLPVVIDRYAHEADGIIIINRIKPHVAFRGPYESGLMKMITIGLGKQTGAAFCHNLGFGHMAEHIPEIAQVVIQEKNILFAVGIVENAYHQTHTLAVLEKEEIAGEEVKLQMLAKQLAPKLFFDRLDVCIMDEIGKDISGTGFDTGVVGRYHTPYISGGPSITKIGVLDLTARSHGNANGIGIVDFTTRRLFDKFDMSQTYPNALTSTVPLSVKIPMVLDNDRQVFQAAVRTCNIIDKTEVRLVRFKNTLSLDEYEISESLREEAMAHPNMEVLSEGYQLGFNEQGNLF